MEEKQLNEKESLELIANMIRNTQKRFQKENASPFLVFGYVTVLLSVIIWYLLKLTGNPHWNILWLSIPALGLLGLKILFPKRRKQVKTFIDKAVDYTWLVIGTCMVLIGILSAFVGFPVLFEIILLIGIAVLLTGLIAKIKLVASAGVLHILSSGLFLFGVVKGIDQILIFGAIFFLFMVVPGHILYLKK